jgi:hypothetical protein
MGTKNTNRIIANRTTAMAIPMHKYGTSIVPETAWPRLPQPRERSTILPGLSGRVGTDCRFHCARTPERKLDFGALRKQLNPEAFGRRVVAGIGDAGFVAFSVESDNASERMKCLKMMLTSREHPESFRGCRRPCRQPLCKRNSDVTPFPDLGKPPRRTGWQPVLPRIASPDAELSSRLLIRLMYVPVQLPITR